MYSTHIFFFPYKLLSLTAKFRKPEKLKFGRIDSWASYIYSMYSWILASFSFSCSSSSCKSTSVISLNMFNKKMLTKWWKVSKILLRFVRIKISLMCICLLLNQIVRLSLLNFVRSMTAQINCFSVQIGDFYLEVYFNLLSSNLF